MKHSVDRDLESMFSDQVSKKSKKSSIRQRESSHLSSADYRNEKIEEIKFEKVKSNLNPRQLKLLEAVTEKGASSWLNALPLKEHNFYLDKQTFWDTIHLRYGLDLARSDQMCLQ